MRRGDLSATGAQIFDPLTGQQFAGNVIPSGRINPIVRQVTELYPQPNRSGLADNYLENNVVTQNQDAFDIRSDFVLGKWGSLFARYSRADRDFVEPPTANIFMSGGNRSESGNYNAVIGHTYTLSSARLNEFRFGVNKYKTSPSSVPISVSRRTTNWGFQMATSRGIPTHSVSPTSM